VLEIVNVRIYGRSGPGSKMSKHPKGQPPPRRSCRLQQQQPVLCEGRTTPTNSAWMAGARGFFRQKTAVLQQALARLARQRQPKSKIVKSK